MTQSDVIEPSPGNPAATIVGDLSNSDLIPADSFDCVILIQTLMTSAEHEAAVKSIYRILKPGGTALVTLPGICKNDSQFDDTTNETPRNTSPSSMQLFRTYFPENALTIQAFGNVLSATSFLQGLSAEELKSSELDHNDPQFPVIHTLTAIKPKD